MYKIAVMNYIYREALSFQWLLGYSRPIVDYCPSTLIDVAIIQSESVLPRAANQERRGRVLTEGAGREVSWRISRQTVATRGEQLRLGSPGVSQLFNELFNHHKLHASSWT